MIRRATAAVALFGALACAGGPLGQSAMAASARSAAAAPQAKSPVPYRTIVGDFNGDGRKDDLFYTPGTGPDWMIYSTAKGFVNGPSIKIDGTYTPATGDFNGDGKTDILWYDPKTANNTSVWYGSTLPGFLHSGPLAAPLSTTTDIFNPSTSDYDGDGKTDVVWFNDGPGSRGAAASSPVWYGNATGFDSGIPVPMSPCSPRYAVAPNQPSCMIITKDFNGDHRDDLLIYRFGRQVDKLYYSKGRSFVRRGRVTLDGYYTPINADFNADNKNDILWYAPGTAPDMLWYGGATGFDTTHAIAINGYYTPVVGDFNGDKKADIVWYGPGTGFDILWYGAAAGFTAGPKININGVYAPAVGDYNGDKKSDILWTAPSGAPSPLWYGATSGFVTGTPISL